jgi:uncharacterized protein (DUF1501 family)
MDDPCTPTAQTCRQASAGRRGVLARGASLGLAAAAGLAGRSAAAIARPAADTRLVVVMLRGAVDGLSVVVPHGDPEYARLRAEIAIAPPGQPDGALPLDGLFGLHPALGPLLPLWAGRRLAFVHASGSHDPTRSHFDAQDHMETATPGRRSIPDGWLNRLLGELGGPVPDAGVRGVNLGPAMPRILVGASQVAALPSGPTPPVAAVSPMLASALDRVYAADPDAAGAWSALRDTQRAMALAGVDGMDAGIAPGAVPLAALERDAARLGRLRRGEPALRAAFFSVGGWDTHVAQGGARGQLALRLGALARGLDALARGMGDRFDDTLVLVMSEFGRTARQNGTQGTDHGHGNAMWLLGGAAAGGRVLGAWPGLDGSALHEGRDLAVTTDFRQVIAEVLERHLRLDDRAIARVLPDGAGPGGRPGVVRG